MRGKRLHGAGLEAPEESGFVQSESPRPPPAESRVRQKPGNAAKARKARSTPPPPGTGFFARLWSGMKLLSGVAIVVGAAVAVAWGAHRYALSTPRFAVRDLTVVGGKRHSDSQVASLAGIEPGANIFALDLDNAERRLLEDPWIKGVKITRELPATLKIELEEREAQALAAVDEHLYLVTRSGEPFKEMVEGDPYDLPVVTGISAENLARDRAREVERIALGIEVLRHYERVALHKIYPAEEAHVEAGGEVVLSVGKAGIQLHLGKGPWRKKLLMAERVVQKLAAKGRVPGIVFLDNQAHPERVVVRMR